MDATAERTRTLAPRADDYGVVPSRTSSAEGRGSGGPPPWMRHAPHGTATGGRCCGGRGTAAGISAPSGRPWKYVATDEPRRGEEEWSRGDAWSAVMDWPTPRASSIGWGGHCLSSACLHSAGHSMPHRATLGTRGKRLAMQKRSGSHCGGKSANWTRTTLQAHFMENSSDYSGLLGVEKQCGQFCFCC